MQFLVIAIGLLMVAAPLASPKGSVVVAVLLWPLVYGTVWLLYSGFDPARSLPWYIADPDRATTSLIIVIGALGLLKGIPSCLAILSIWAPLLLLPSWLLDLGVTAEHKAGRTCYVLDNYNNSCGDRNRGYVCRYTPREGRRLPSFAQANSIGSGRILAVYPFSRGDP